MAKWRKTKGVHHRRENGKEITYKQGCVIDAEEEELRIHDPSLSTWQRVEDDTKIMPSISDNCDIRSKEEWRYLFNQSSWILGNKPIPLREMISNKDLLWQRETDEIDKDGFHIGSLKLAEESLQNAWNEWDYHNAVQPVSGFRKEPHGKFLSNIWKAEALIEVITEEIICLRQKLQPVLKSEEAAKKRREQREAEQKKLFANHPAFKKEGVLRCKPTPRELKRTLAE